SSQPSRATPIAGRACSAAGRADLTECATSTRSSSRPRRRFWRRLVTPCSTGSQSGPDDADMSHELILLARTPDQRSTVVAALVADRHWTSTPNGLAY